MSTGERMSAGPEVLHVGFSKCASTFLQNFFAGHPGIFLVNQSHFFAPFDFSDFESGKEKYRRLFEPAKPGQLRLESDEHIVLPLFHPVLRAAATTLDSVSEVSSRIKNLQPNARIILVIRNQIDLIVSRYSEYILGGGKGSFGFFVTEFLSCSKDGVNYYQNYYSRIIDIFASDFGRDNVLVLMQEELARDERATIERLCTFLGVDVRQPTRHGLISQRVGLSDLGIKAVRSMNRLLVTRQEMSRERARARIPYHAYKVLQRGLRTIDYYLPRRLKGDKKAALTPALRQRLEAEFADDNRQLAEVLQLAVGPLGYPVG